MYRAEIPKSQTSLVNELPSKEIPKVHVLYDNDLCKGKFQDLNDKGVDENDEGRTVQQRDLLLRSEVSSKTKLGRFK